MPLETLILTLRRQKVLLDADLAAFYAVPTKTLNQAGEFSVSALQNQCPGVGVDLIRQVLERLRGSRVACLGRGQSAKWKKLGN